MKLLEGKVKTVFETENAEEVMIEYHDKVTAGNGEKTDYGKGYYRSGCPQGNAGSSKTYVCQ